MTCRPVSAANAASSIFQARTRDPLEPPPSAQISSRSAPGVAGTPDGVPPAAQCRDGERRGVVVGADGDPAGVGRDVVDAVRDRLAQLLVGEVAHVDLLGLPGRLVLPTAVLELPDQLLLLGIDRDHGLTGPGVLGDLGCQIAELRVPVGMLVAFGDLAVGLQPKALGAQHPGHRAIRGRMAQLSQRTGQVLGRLGRPDQQRHWVASGLGVHQRPQLRRQLRVGHRQLLATTARSPHPPLWLDIIGQLPHTSRHRVRVRPGRPSNRLDPTATQLGGLGPQQQSTLPLSRCGRSAAYRRASDCTPRPLSAIAQP